MTQKAIDMMKYISLGFKSTWKETQEKNDIPAMLKIIRM
jgi:hypothetical protein